MHITTSGAHKLVHTYYARRCFCGNDTVAVAMRFVMRNGQICFSLRKFLAIAPAIQKIVSDCGCDAVVHLGEKLYTPPDFGQKASIRERSGGEYFEAPTLAGFFTPLPSLLIAPTLEGYF